jgi:glycosyltransferase involved in cell wall biosynthesis
MMNRVLADSLLISVIIPTYQHGEHLLRCITSVLNQTYRNIEIIVIDNYSDDDTREIILRLQQFHPAKIFFYQYNNDGVIARSRNYGVKQSRGEIIAFLDSDDEWLPSKLCDQISYFNQANVAAVASTMQFIGFKELAFQSLKQQHFEYTDYLFKSILLNNPIVTSSVLMKKDIFLKAQGFDEEKRYAFIEDWELWLRLTVDGHCIRVLSKPLVKYFVSEKQSRNAYGIVLNRFGIIKKYSFLKGSEKLLVEANAMLNLQLVSIQIKHLLSIDVKRLLTALIYTRGYHRLRALVMIFIMGFSKKQRRVLFDVVVRLRAIILN